MHLAAAGAAVEQAVLIGGGAEHADLDLGDVAVGGAAHRMDQVERGVARGAVRAALAAHQHDGNRTVLDHEAENRRGVGHGVGAVPDDDAIHPRGDLLADGLRQGHVFGPAHVLREDREQLAGGEIADVGELGHRAVELTRGEGRNDRPGAVVESGSDGAVPSRVTFGRSGRGGKSREGI